MPELTPPRYDKATRVAISQGYIISVNVSFFPAGSSLYAIHRSQRAYVFPQLGSLYSHR